MPRARDAQHTGIGKTAKQRKLPGNDEQWEERLMKALAYCSKKRWKVEFAPDTKVSLAWLDAKTIQVGGKATLRTQYYMLLHEMGHLALGNKVWYHEKFGFPTDRKSYSQVGKMLVLEEEIMAWHEGRKIAENQGWGLDTQFEVVKAAMLSTYSLWVTHRKHPHKNFKRASY